MKTGWERDVKLLEGKDFCLCGGGGGGGSGGVDDDGASDYFWSGRGGLFRSG